MTVVATLPRLWIPVSGYVVTPVLAWWHEPHPVSPVDLAEVAAGAAPADPGAGRPGQPGAGTPSERIHRARRSSVRGLLVWGFTAGVITTLLELGGWAQPWDESRVRRPAARVG